MTTFEQRRHQATARFAREIMDDPRLADRLADRIFSAYQEIADEEAAERDALDAKLAEVLHRELDENSAWAGIDERERYLRAAAAMREYLDCHRDGNVAGRPVDDGYTDIDIPLYTSAFDIPDRHWFRSSEPDVTVSWYREGLEFWRQPEGSGKADGPYTAKHVDGLYPQRVFHLLNAGVPL